MIERQLICSAEWNECNHCHQTEYIYVEDVRRTDTKKVDAKRNCSKCSNKRHEWQKVKQHRITKILKAISMAHKHNLGECIVPNDSSEMASALEWKQITRNGNRKKIVAFRFISSWATTLSSFFFCFLGSVLLVFRINSISFVFRSNERCG